MTTVSDNITNTTECLNHTQAQLYTVEYTAFNEILIRILIPSITAFGIAANSAFLFVIYRLQDMRTTTNIYLANLAVADSLVLLSGCAQYLGKYLASPVVDYHYATLFKHRAGCELPYLVFYAAVFASLFFITLVAYERYIAVCKPVLHRRIKSPARTCRLSLMAWLIPLIFVTIHAGAFRHTSICLDWDVTTGKYDRFPRIIRKCKWEDWVAVSICTFELGQFVIAFIANGTMYAKIIQTLNKRSYKQGSRTAGAAANHISRMILIIAVVCFSCSLPKQILNVGIISKRIEKSTADDYGISNDGVRLLFWVGVFAGFFNSAINPVIYNVTNRDYRMAFRRAFKCPSKAHRPLTPNCSSKITRFSADRK